LMIVRAALTVVFLIFAVWGKRWAYVGFIVLSLLYFPMKVGFALDPHPCEWIFGPGLAIHSLSNLPHIVLFAFLFLITSRQFDMSNWTAFGWAALCTIGLGLLLELAQGVSGNGHCRMRDLIPDSVGTLIGVAVVLAAQTVWRKFGHQGADEVTSRNSRVDDDVDQIERPTN